MWVGRTFHPQKLPGISTTSRRRTEVRDGIGIRFEAVLPSRHFLGQNIRFQQDITDQLNYDGSSSPDSKVSLTKEPPFNYYHAGNAALFDEHFRNNYPVSNYSNSTAQIPSPAVFRGTKKIALLVVRQSTNNCTSLNETIFGNQTSMTKLIDLYSYHNDYDENCFLIGTVNFTAGAIRSSKATYITPRVIEMEKDSSSSIDSDNWVIESLYALPNVMPKVSLLNVSQLATWDNIDGYIENLIRISYQTTWGEYSGFNTVPLNFKGPSIQKPVTGCDISTQSLWIVLCSIPRPRLGCVVMDARAGKPPPNGY
ncbi:hypothetical protein K440DRAFT_641243 [Wilcoxina mikolae CBS 423.85]|nr:hypothetical protein K440DRAFT_641243 [Wilcoxina mikolae CBS 423.85]